MLFVAVLLPVDDVPAVQVRTGARIVPPAAARNALEFQPGAVLEVVVIVAVFGGEALVVVQVVVGVECQSVRHSALEQTQTQTVLRLLVL